MSNTPVRGFLATLLLALILPAAPAMAESEFCSDPGCKATRQAFKQLCDYIVANKRSGPYLVREGRIITSIFASGYYMRALVAGYEIFGDRSYLDVAIAFADDLVKKQTPIGYWGTGHGGVEIADTGSAVGLFSVLNRHVDRDRQEKYVAAVRRYVTAVEKDGFIHPSGALGYGWATQYVAAPGPAKGGVTKESEEITTIRNDDYTIATALTGGEVFTWMYHLTKDDQYRRVAFNALRWILGTMRKDGVIPYGAGTEGAFLEQWGNPANDFRLWDENPYQASTYVGEGLIAFDSHCDQSEWKAEIRRQIRPHIEFLLRTQNSNGTWGIRRAPTYNCLGNMDPTRSPGVANLLIWYYEQVDKDPRIVNAVRRFDQFLLNPAQARAFGLLSSGAEEVLKCHNSDAVTSLTGYALADILVPGITSRW